MSLSLEGREKIRHKAEDRYLVKLDRQLSRAEPMVGELLSGRFYCYPVGGRYFEAASRLEVIQHLIKRRYV